MLRVVFLLIFSVGVPSAPCQNQDEQGAQSKTMPVPPTLPFLDWKACPFEGCAYGQWTARKSTIVYSTWKQGRQRITQLSPGDKVTGITGVVITFKPGLIRMERDFPNYGLKRGDAILTYAYRGEGFAAVWFKGRYFPEFDISFTKWPDGGGCGGAHCAATYVEMGKKVWWAQVKLKSGRIGWVDMEQADFDGIDLLGKSGDLPTYLASAECRYSGSVKPVSGRAYPEFDIAAVCSRRIDSLDQCD